MKISTALKKGSKRMRHIKGEYFSDHRGACALGAISRGFGIDPLQLDSYGVSGMLLAKIANMNDEEGASFNEIYLWLKKRGL